MINDKLKAIFKKALEHEITESIKKDLSDNFISPTYKDFKKEITRIRNLSKYKVNKKEEIRFGDKIKFFEWYLNNWNEDGSTTCAYCGVSEKDCKKYLFDEKHTKRSTTRSQHLEIEKKDANQGYKEENCILTCYVCNNAKSDFMSIKEFRPTARAINFFWRHVLKKPIPFPIEFWKEEAKRWKNDKQTT